MSYPPPGFGFEDAQLDLLGAFTDAARSPLEAAHSSLRRWGPMTWSERVERSRNRLCPAPSGGLQTFR